MEARIGRRLVNDETGDRNAKLGARRRLLRGGFAAPAVLTLYSGSVLASASSCLRSERQSILKSIPAPPVAPFDSSDTWVRYQLRVLTTKEGETHYVHAEFDDSSMAGRFLKFDIASNQLTAEEATFEAAQLQLSGRYAAVRINCDGKAVGVGNFGDGFVSSLVAAASLGAAFVANG